MRIGVGALSIFNFNVTVECNAFYHSIMAVDGQVNENTGETEMISSKSIQNTIRYNTFLNTYGHDRRGGLDHRYPSNLQFAQCLEGLMQNCQAKVKSVTHTIKIEELPTSQMGAPKNSLTPAKPSL